MIYGIGIDCQGMAETRRSLRQFGRRYLDRVFAPEEVAVIGLDGPPSERQIAQLTERFSAKEAVYKALRPPARLFGGWSQINLDTTGPAIKIRLNGELQRWAVEARVRSISLSFSSDSGFILAMAIAETSETEVAITRLVAADRQKPN